MPVVVVTSQSYGHMVRTLRDYEGWRSLWRVPVSAALIAAVPLFLVGVTVAAGAVAGDDFEFGTALAAAIVAVGGSTFVYPRLARRKLHRKLIADRLWTWEKPNPASQVPVLVRSPDVRETRAVLRRAKFNPGVGATHLGSPPSDAADLDARIAVEEPDAWPQSADDADRVRRISAALATAGIRARVAGIDVGIATKSS